MTLCHADKEFSAFTLGQACPSLLYLGTNDGEVGGYDTRAGALSHPFAARHGRKVNTLSIDAGRDWLLASAGSDAAVHVWDARRLSGGGGGAKPVATLSLPKASQAAEWAPDGSGRLAVTCFDDRLRVFSLAALADKAAASSAKSVPAASAEPALAVRHCTATGRWVRAPGRPSSCGALQVAPRHALPLRTGGPLPRDVDGERRRRARRRDEEDRRGLRSGQRQQARLAQLGAHDRHPVAQRLPPGRHRRRRRDQLGPRPHLQDVSGKAPARRRLLPRATLLVRSGRWQRVALSYLASLCQCILYRCGSIGPWSAGGWRARGLWLCASLGTKGAARCVTRSRALTPVSLLRTQTAEFSNES